MNMESEHGGISKMPLFTFLSNQGLQTFLQNDAFIEKNKEILSTVSQIIALYSKDKYELFENMKNNKMKIPCVPIQITDPDSFKKIYENIKEAYPQVLQSPHYIDFNHGTTPMRTFAFFLCIKNPKNVPLEKIDERKKNPEFSYEKKDKPDWDAENTKLQPFLDIYIVKKEQDLKIARQFFSKFDFKAAVEVLKNLHETVVSYARKKDIAYVDYLIRLGDAFYCWDRFGHRTNTEYNPIRHINKAKDIASNHDDSYKKEKRKEELESIHKFLVDCAGNLRQGKLDSENDEMLADRFHNAQLRLSQGLYDDATARFYSLAEAIAKRVLLEKHNINNSKLKLEDKHIQILSRSKCGNEIIKEFEWQKEQEKKLGLVKSYKLLGCLGDPIANIFFENASNGQMRFDPNKEFDPKEIILLEKRNETILAHGKNIVKKEDAEIWENVCKKLLDQMGIKEQDYWSIQKACLSEVLFAEFE